MGNKLGNFSYHIKTFILTILLLVESLYLTILIGELVQSQNYFTMNFVFSLKIVGLMLAIIYTFSLTVGAWAKWEQYLIVPLPISIGIFLALFQTNLTYAMLIAVFAFVLLIFDIHRSTAIKNLLIKFDPKLILRFSTKGLLFIFSVLGGLMVILNSTYVEPINIGQKISEVAGEKVNEIVEEQFRQQVQEQISPLGITDLSEIDPSFAPVLEDLGLSSDFLTNANDSVEPQDFGIDAKQIVESQVNNIIEPYKNFVNPVLAVLMFALFQFYAFLAHLIFIATIDLVFWLSKTTHFFKTEKVPVEQERLRF